VYAKVPNYAVGRRYDVVLRDPKTGQMGGIEIKRTLSEFNDTMTKQADADTYVNRFGGEMFGTSAENSGVAGQRLGFAAKIYWDPEW
jgi:hypothetical protein